LDNADIVTYLLQFVCVSVNSSERPY